MDRALSSIHIFLSDLTRSFPLAFWANLRLLLLTVVKFLPL